MWPPVAERLSAGAVRSLRHPGSHDMSQSHCGGGGGAVNNFFFRKEQLNRSNMVFFFF